MKASKKHILLLGGTGICGQIFTKAALEVGHSLTLYCRTPSKLPSQFADHENLTIIQGTLEDEEGLSSAADCGADVLISLAGPTLGQREGTPITSGLRALFPRLLAANPAVRILVLATASYSAPQDKRSLTWFFAINGFIRVVGGDSYPEIRGIADQTVSLGEGVDWTVFRVPLLRGDTLGEAGVGEGGEGEEVNAGFVGADDGGDGLFLDRGRFARWILQELEEKRWVRSCPTLANA